MASAEHGRETPAALAATVPSQKEPSPPQNTAAVPGPLTKRTSWLLLASAAEGINNKPSRMK